MNMCKVSCSIESLAIARVSASMHIACSSQRLQTDIIFSEGILAYVEKATVLYHKNKIPIKCGRGLGVAMLIRRVEINGCGLSLKHY